ncbi:MAG: RNA methyltransferase [Rickettsiales bacterium]|nr:RNA methyltransferase [Rickettsiales bacterium]
MPSLSPPTIVMVRPQMGENIGAVARAMMNFGLTDLRLVAPRDGWPNPKAHEMAAHADYLIEQARVYATVAEALADRQYVLAASARERVMSLPDYSPEAAASLLHHCAHAGESTALLLGPESTGLSNDDMAFAHGIVCIPTDPANHSLNVAQALVVLAYQWFVAAPSPEPLAQDELPRATVSEREGLYEHLVQELEKKDYFRPTVKREGMLRALRVLLNRTSWSSQEVRTLRGIVRCLGEAQGKSGN